MQKLRGRAVAYWSKFSRSEDFAACYTIFALLVSLLCLYMAYGTVKKVKATSVEIPVADQSLMSLLVSLPACPLEGVDDSASRLASLCASFPLNKVEIKEESADDKSRKDDPTEFNSRMDKMKIDKFGIFRDYTLTYSGDITEQMWLLKQIQTAMRGSLVVKELQGKSDSMILSIRIYGLKQGLGI